VDVFNVERGLTATPLVFIGEEQRWRRGGARRLLEPTAGTPPIFFRICKPEQSVRST
jgi:hypothetical protein